ncbi:MAG: peptide deformylase [Lachnospiraceae bacterium]|nr:peptide deformylase [Lachnospiraceae bacterium]
MAIREIREMGDAILTKKSKEIKKLSFRNKILIEDMLDTMYDKAGVGLAAPQVGVLKRIVTIDIGEGPVVLINPEIVEEDGSQTGEEGCLSLPGKWGIVTRPERVKVRYFDREMEATEIEGEGLMARALCHEIDHLEGALYADLVEDGLHDVSEKPPMQEEEESIEQEKEDSHETGDKQEEV